MRTFKKVLLCAAGLFSLSAQPAFAQAETDLDKKAWDSIAGRIVQIYQGKYTGAPAVLGIQFVTVPKALPVDDPDTFKALLLDLDDTIPEWGPNWVPHGNFADAYRLFAESIAIPHRTDVSPTVFQKTLDDYTDLHKQTNAAYGRVLHEYTKYRKDQSASNGPLLPWNAWMQRLSQTASAWQSLESQRQKLLPKLLNLYDPTARVIGSWKDRMISYDFDPSSDYVENVPRYPYNYASAKAALQTIIKDASSNEQKQTYMFDLDASRDTFTSNMERSSWGGHASYGPFFSGGASGSHFSLETDTEENSITVKARGFGRVSVSPGAWFAQALIDWEKHQPGEPFLPGSTISNATLFGPSGSMNLRPVELIVMVKPVLTAHLSKNTYKQVIDTLNAGGGVSFGPFSFGGSYSKTTESVTKDDQSGRITITNTSDTPYVVAVVNQKINHTGP